MAYKPKDHQERVLHRLKIAQGQLKKVIQLVETQAYCIDVIHQSQAVQKALKEIDHLILEEHLQTCAAEAIQSGEKEKAVSEVIQVFKRMS